jgi:hypothetical protein
MRLLSRGQVALSETQLLMVHGADGYDDFSTDAPPDSPPFDVPSSYDSSQPDIQFSGEPQVQASNESGGVGVGDSGFGQVPNETGMPTSPAINETPGWEPPPPVDPWGQGGASLPDIPDEPFPTALGQLETHRSLHDDMLSRAAELDRMATAASQQGFAAFRQEDAANPNVPLVQQLRAMEPHFEAAANFQDQAAALRQDASSVLAAGQNVVDERARELFGKVQSGQSLMPFEQLEANQIAQAQGATVRPYVQVAVKHTLSSGTPLRTEESSSVGIDTGGFYRNTTMKEGLEHKSSVSPFDFAAGIEHQSGGRSTADPDNGSRFNVYGQAGIKTPWPSSLGELAVTAKAAASNGGTNFQPEVRASLSAPNFYGNKLTLELSGGVRYSHGTAAGRDAQMIERMNELAALGARREERIALEAANYERVRQGLPPIAGR